MTKDQIELLRPGFEAAIIERFKESGFLEVEIRVECLTRCGESYNDPQVAIAWWSWTQSRESLVVELPDEQPGYLYYAPDVVAAIMNGGGGIREPFVVELPPEVDQPEGDGLDCDDVDMWEMQSESAYAVNGMRHACKAAIIAAGGTVKS